MDIVDVLPKLGEFSFPKFNFFYKVDDGVLP